MKVLLTTLTLDPESGGGTTERTRRLAKYLRRAGVEVRVVSIGGGALANELEAEGIRTYSTGAVRLGFTFPLVWLPRLSREVAWADHIHILGYWNLLSVAMAHCARRKAKPYVFSAAGEFEGPSHFGWVARTFHERLGLPMVRGAARIVSITELERSQILARLGLPPEEVVTIENGVEESLVSAPVQGLPKAPYLLFLGRLAKVKGPDILLEAFGRIASVHPELRLVVAGPDHGLGRQLLAAADSATLAGRVVFTGYLDEAQRTTALRGAEGLVVPSRSEAMSLVALEAGMQAVPVVVTDRCGLDVVADIGAGTVCPATVEGLAAGLQQFLQADDRQGMGARWKAHVSTHYLWPNLVDRMIAMFESIDAARR